MLDRFTPPGNPRLAPPRNPRDRSSRWSSWGWVVLWTCLGAGLRFWNLGDKPPWADEWSTLLFSLGQGYQGIPLDQPMELATLLAPLQQPVTWDLGQVWERLGTESNHPPLYFWLTHGWLWLWTHLGGAIDPRASRSLSSWLGVVTIPLTYGVARRLSQGHPLAVPFAHLGALLMAVSPFGTYLAQEARHYTLSVAWILLLMPWMARSRQAFLQGHVIKGHRHPDSPEPVALSWRGVLLWIGLNGLALGTHLFYGLALAGGAIALMIPAWVHLRSPWTPAHRALWGRLLTVGLATVIPMGVWVGQGQGEGELTQWLQRSPWDGATPWGDRLGSLVEPLGRLGAWWVTMILGGPMEGVASPGFGFGVVAAGLGGLVWLLVSGKSRSPLRATPSTLTHSFQPNSPQINSPLDNSFQTNSPQTNSPLGNSFQTNSPQGNPPQSNSPLDNSFQNNSPLDNSFQTNSPQTNSPLGNSFQSNSTQGNLPLGNSSQTNSTQSNSPLGNSFQTNSPLDNSFQTNSPLGNSFQTNSPQSNSFQSNSPQTHSPQTNSFQTNSTQTNAFQSNSPQTNSPLGNSAVNPAAPLDNSPWDNPLDLLLPWLGGCTLITLILVYGQGLDLTLAPRYQFVVFPLVILAIAWQLAHHWATPRRDWVWRRGMVAAIVALGIMGSVSVSHNWLYQKSDQADVMVQQLLEIWPPADVAPDRLTIALLHRTTGETGKLLSLGWEFQRLSQKTPPPPNLPTPSPQFYLAHWQDDREQGTQSLHRFLATAPRPLTLWVVNFSGARQDVEPFGCQLASAQHPKAPGYWSRLYHCGDRPSPQDAPVLSGNSM